MSLATPQIWLAPLRGLTGALFRNTYAEFFDGIDGAVTPFLTTIQGVRIKPSQLGEVLPANNTRIPAVPQIISKNPDNFVSLATALHQLGYDTVNWNLGCPFARVAQKQRGSGMLPHPDRIDAFLDKAMGAIAVQVSIKLRLGRHHPQEILSLLPVFNRYPIQSLIIHPRTGVQMYTGRPDLDGFQALRQRFPGVAGWMIGRGVLANPFLPAQIKGLDLAGTDRVARFQQFHDALHDRFACVRQGPAQLLDTMKGYWTYFAGGFQHGEKLLKRVRKVRRIEQYREVVAAFWSTLEEK